MGYDFDYCGVPGCSICGMPDCHSCASLRARIAELEKVVGATRLKRNTIIDPDFHVWARDIFIGKWVAVPEEDFDKLYAALAEVGK